MSPDPIGSESESDSDLRSGTPTPLSDSALPRTYGRTYGDKMVTREDRLTKANARVRRAFDLGEYHEQALAGLPVGFAGPRRDCAFGFVYVVEFSFGVVKVGQTIAPRGRMRQHTTDAVRFNGEVTSWWVSPAHLDWRQNEAALITWCDDNGRQTFGEYFTDVTYADTLEFAVSLNYRQVRRSTEARLGTSASDKANEAHRATQREGGAS